MTETIGSRIKRLRTERGLNISQLSEAIDFSTYTIRKWESDEFNPSMLALIALADEFDMSLDEIVGCEQKAKRDHRGILSKALWFFGEDSQLGMLHEEMAELVCAINRFKRGRGAKCDIAEEIADVEIMLSQMKLLFECEEQVENIIEDKLMRLNNRIEESALK